MATLDRRFIRKCVAPILIFSVPKGCSAVSRRWRIACGFLSRRFDEDGTLLWPELMERLDAAPRYGTLIVTRDRLDRRRKVHLPWKEDYFRHRIADIREAAGIDFSAKFMGLRHGGSTESGNAELTDARSCGVARSI